jgi:hypothetical protein
VDSADGGRRRRQRRTAAEQDREEDRVMTDEPTMTTKIIKAEDAPLGVPLWPADSEVLLPHHTLEQVEVVQSVRSLVGNHGPFVRWTFVSGTTRSFRLAMRSSSRCRAKITNRQKPANSDPESS